MSKVMPSNLNTRDKVVLPIAACFIGGALGRRVSAWKYATTTSVMTILISIFDACADELCRASASKSKII